MLVFIELTIVALVFATVAWVVLLYLLAPLLMGSREPLNEFMRGQRILSFLAPERRESHHQDHVVLRRQVALAGSVFLSPIVINLAPHAGVQIISNDNAAPIATPPKKIEIRL